MSSSLPSECENRTVIIVRKIHLCIYYKLLASSRNTIHVNLTSTDLLLPNGFIWIVCCVHIVASLHLLFF